MEALTNISFQIKIKQKIIELYNNILKNISFFKVRFREAIQYKTAAFAGVLTQFAWAGMYMMLFSTFLENGTENDMSIAHMSTFIWLQQSLYALINISNVDKDIYEQIRNGNIAIDLVKPIDIYNVWYYKTLGKKVAMVTLRFIPIILISSLPILGQYRVIIQTNPTILVLSVISLILSTALTMSYIMMMLALIMILISSDGIKILFQLILEFFSGMVIPISFMPTKIATILKFTPFYYIQNITFNIYSGYMSNSKEILINLIMQVFWIIVLTILSKMIIKKRLSKITIQGG